MPVLSLPALMLFQDAASTATDLHVIMWCEIILTAIVVLLLLTLAIGGLVAYSKITALTKQVNVKAQPLLAKGQQIAGNVNEIIADLKPKIATISADLQPKIASVSSDVQHISSVVRSKVDEAGQTFTNVNQTVKGYNETAQDVNQKVRGQVDRVNGMVSETLTTTQQVSKQIQHGIKVPVEKIASWITAAKLGIENLAEKVPFLQHSAPSNTPGGTSRPGPRPVVRNEPTPMVGGVSSAYVPPKS